MSQLFTWNDSLCTGINSIDEQHKGIVDLINQLHDAIKENNRDTVTQILGGLINYTASHFSFEEELQRQHNYPSTQAHKKKHDAFIERISKYKEKHDAGEDIAKKLSGELILWLTSHIKKEDQDYIPYCNKSIKQSFLDKIKAKYFN